MADLKVEFHCHTIVSKDSLTTPQRLLAACRKKGIDRVIITDHNTIRGALQAQALDPARVIVGEEIMTTEGELLAAFVQEEIPAGLTPGETIARLRAQGAFISVSHPYDIFRSGHWRPAALLEITPLVDAIETFNARCWLPRFNRRAAAYARQYHLLGTVGSDAHTASELGAATLRLPSFQDAPSLKAALGQSQPQTRLSGPWVHLFSKYATISKKLTKRE